MKRPIIVLAGALVVLLAGCESFPPWWSFPSGQQAEYGRIETGGGLLQFLAFADDPGISAIAIQSSSSSSPARYAILLDRPAREDMRAACAKFESWKRLAEENQTEITKPITTLYLPQVYYRYGSWHDAGDREISLVFSSSVDDSGQQISLLTLRPSPVFMRRGFYLVYGQDSLVLSENQAKTFGELLQEKAVADGYQKARKKQDVIDMFK